MVIVVAICYLLFTIQCSCLARHFAIESDLV